MPQLIAGVDLFGASVQVIALVASLVCFISAILGRAVTIGPIGIPAPAALWPRAALGSPGLVLFTIACWSNLVGSTSLLDLIDRFFHPTNSAFAADNESFTDLLSKTDVALPLVRIRAERLYAEASVGRDRCLIVLEIADVYRGNVDAYPQSALADAARFQRKSSDTQDMAKYEAQLRQLTQVSIAVTQQVVAAAPALKTISSPSSNDVASRPSPSIQVQGEVSQDTARRVLRAQTLPGDDGWMFVGFRDRNSDELIGDRRIEAREIPRSGIVATIADSELLVTKDPGIYLGTVRGYVPAGSAVEIRAISGPRHYTNGEWDGYDVYANVVVKSIPGGTPIAAATAAPTSAAAGPGPAFAAASPAAVAIASAPRSGCSRLPATSATVFTYCNETYPVHFGKFTFRSYKVTDSHSTGVHFRVVGPSAVYLSILPDCAEAGKCPDIRNVLVPPVSAADDGSNDYIYTVETLQPVAYGWSIETSPSH